MKNALYIIAVTMFIAWTIGWFVFHVPPVIHTLLAIAMVAIVLRAIEGPDYEQ